jgi:PadR family transcriptional regulator PadR
MRAVLGAFEQAVMQAVIHQRGDGYGMTIRREVAERTGRDTSIGAIYTTLSRLEAKGLVTSRAGKPTPERGGRAKRYFKIEAAGLRALEEARIELQRVWEPRPLGAHS